ncbi:MAG: PIN domain-containing protein [Crocosphaera sp.]|nr:PIN domain-containing protein [Crocosphaera sp.]
MLEIFVDTSGWGNLVDKSQPLHQLMVQLYREAKQQQRRLITSNYVITEVVALLTSPLRIPRPKIISFVNSLKQSPYIDIIHIDKEKDNDAWLLLASREDKEWSLVDCSSFIIMKERGILEALTNDIHFEQAGFIRLLK